MLITLSETITFGEAMVRLFLLVFVMGIIAIVLGYFALKVFANFVNIRRNLWQETARELGLEMQHEYYRL